MLQDCENVQCSFEAHATEDKAEKFGLQQKVTVLEGEVLRLQSGVEQVRQITYGVGYLLFPIWL
jgi:hypothetical protein